MTPQDWRRVKDVLNAVMERPPAERPVFLASACESDLDLRRHVEALIASAEETWEGVEPSLVVPTKPPARERTGSTVGQRIGAYEISAEIGHGGMGTVYAARRADDQFRKRVAIKIVRRGMDTDSVLRRFRNERQILAALDHPNIARLLDGGVTADGLPYLVMEYVEGQQLLEYCDRHKLATGDRLGLFRSVCAAVHFAHQNLVVHRDLKPSNILVTPEGVPKLLDFGIAKLLNPELGSQTMEYTESAMRLMTPDYASPEQVRGEPITTSSDVYSLGVVLYELLTGHRPYRVKNAQPQEIARVVGEQVPDKPSTAVTRVEEVPGPAGSGTVTVTPQSVSITRDSEPEKLRRRLRGDLDTIVFMAMRKEPQRRYASVEQLSEDVLRHLEGRPVIARTDTFGYRAGKFIRRHRTAVAAAGLAILALVAGLVMTLREKRVAEFERARAERRFNDVRKLAGSFLFEFHDAIRNLPGSTPARELVVKRALEYLNDLSKESSSDPTLRRDLAAAYQKVGDVQGNRSAANLGDTPGAIKSYRKALELREALAAQEPGNAEVQGELGVTLDSIGDILSQTGDKAGALDAYRRALKIREALVASDPKGVAARRSLATSYHHMAGFLADGREYREALAVWRKEIDLFEALWREDPKDTRAQRNVALSYKYTGGTLEALGDKAAALELYRKAVALDEARSAADPTDAEARIDLSFSYGALSVCLSNMGDLDGALEAYRKAFAIRQVLAEADPKNVNAQGALARAHFRIGQILERKGDPASARESYRKGLAIQEGLSKVDPSNEAAREGVALALGRVADVEAALGSSAKTPVASRPGHWREARSLYQRSLDIWFDHRRRGVLQGANAGEPDRVAQQLARCDEALKKR
jgi:serine/threonine protein kinase/tetratricopeptide (TPR) repeat protein